MDNHHKLRNASTPPYCLLPGAYGACSRSGWAVHPKVAPDPKAQVFLSHGAARLIERLDALVCPPASAAFGWIGMTRFSESPAALTSRVLIS